MPAARLLAHRFLLQERLGGGGMGEVYRALDKVSGELVALKIVHGASLAREALESEFRALSALRHESVVRVFDYGLTDDGAPFFTMELLEGGPLGHLLDGGDLEGGGALLAQLCGALVYLHGRGLVHGDLKPSNIWLVPRPQGRAQIKLLDFGLARLASKDLRAERLTKGAPGGPVATAGGTVEYMAPELIRGAAPDIGCDLYALGCVLYECFSGRPPFADPDPRQVVQAQLGSEPDDPASWPRPPHPALREVILGLLAKDAARRYQSADEVIEAFNEAAGTSLAIAADMVAEGGAAFAGVLVGRAAELEKLERLQRAAVDGDGAVCLLGGEQGVGKSRLLAEVAATARLAGLTVLELEIDGQTQQSAAQLSRLRERLGALLPDASSRAGEIEGALPDTVAELLSRVGQARPLLLLVDRVAGPPLLDLLVDVAVMPATRLLLLAAEDAGAASSVQARLAGLERVQTIQLGPLSPAEVRQLLGEQVGPRERLDDLGAFCLEHSGGNPGGIMELLAFMVARGHLRRRRGRFWLWPANLDLRTLDVPPRAGLTESLLRVAGSAAESHQLLAACAVAGGELGGPGLTRLAGLDDASFLRAAARLQRQGLLSGAAGPGHGLRFVRAEAQRALLGSLLPEARRDLHLRAAQLLQEQAEERAEAEAEAEENLVAICRHLALAGDLARVRELVAPALAALERSGASGEAVALCQTVLALTVEPGERAPLRARAAALELRLGNAAAAAAGFEQAAGEAEAGEVAAEAAASAVGLAAELPAELLCRAAEARVAAGEPKAALETLERAAGMAHGEQAAARIALAGAWALFLGGEFVQAVERCRHGLTIARAVGKRSLVAESLVLLGHIQTSRGALDEALCVGGEALQLYQNLGEPQGIAEASLELGRTEYFRGNYDAADHHYGRALGGFQRLGNLLQLGKCQNNLAIVAYLRGEWERAAGLWEQYRMTCERTGSRTEVVLCLNNLGVLYRDRGDFARAERHLVRSARMALDAGMTRARAMASGNLGEIAMRQGNFVEAMTAFDECGRMAREVGARDELLELERRFCELELLRREDSAATLRRAEPALAEARSLGSRVETANLLRIIGSVRRRSGQRAEAETALQEAASLLAGSRSSLEAGRLDVERALLLRDQQEFVAAQRLFEEALDSLRHLGAEWDIKQAREAWRTQTAANSELQQALTRGAILDEMWRSLEVDVGLEALLAKIVDRVVELAAADRGFLVLVDDDGRPLLRLGRRMARADLEKEEFRVSETIIGRVLREGCTLDVLDTSEDEQLRGQRSVMSLGLRSILCVPLRHAGRTLGVIYVDSQHITERSMRRDLKLFEALAAQCGVLVANLRLLEEEKRRTLTMATVVHELRNPLAAIQAGLGAIELIEKNRSPQTDTILQMATQQVRRLSNIIRDLLALARMEAGKTEWAFAAMDIRMVIKQAVEALGPLAAERNVRVVADLPDSLPMAFGHPDRVTQVVTNLVANGLRFVAAGSGEVVVTARVASGSAAGSVQSEGHFVDLVSRQDLRISEQQHIEVRVGDNGPGISPEDQRQLFHPFSQVGKDKRREEAGSGLGLAICREIVRRHGGRIWVASEPGKGAEFVFTLPMVKSELASA